MFRRVAIGTITLIILLSIGSALQLPRLGFDYNFENFFPTNDPDLSFYREFSQTFEPDNDFVLIGIENKAGIFDDEFLKKIASLTDSLEGLPYVKLVNSPTRASTPVVGPFGIINIPYLHVGKPELYEKDSIRIYNSEQMVGTLFASDAKAISILIKTEAKLSKLKTDEFVIAMNAVLAQYTFDDLHVSGRAEGQYYYIEKLKWELGIFMGSSLILLILFLFIAFRSFWGIWVPVTVVALSALWLLALMAVTGKDIDIMTALLPTILFVVGMSDAVHIISRYLEELRNGHDKLTAIKVTFKQIGIATFLTSLTTAIGFLTLLTSGVSPIREFGLYTAAGVFVAFILSFSLLPSILILYPKPKIADQTNDKLFWYRLMRNLFQWVIQKRKIIIVSGVVFIGICLIGISKVEVNNYLLEDLSDNDPHKQDFIFFEEHFSGVRPFEMVVTVKDSSASFLDYHVLQEIDKIEKYLNMKYGIGFIASPNTLAKTLNQAFNGGNTNYYKLPEDEASFRKIRPLVKQFYKRPELREMVTEDHMRGRISGKMSDIGGKRVSEMNQQFLQFLDTNIDQSLIEYKLTGMPLLIDKNNETLISNMMTGLLIAFGVIALIMGLLYRSLVIVVVSLIPNILPLLVVGCIMGLTGIDMKVSTSIVFTIAFGIAVDDTIHFMSKLKLELGKGKSLPYALKRTMISTGKAISVTTIILCSGFLTLILSTFMSTFYIGLLISITLASAVLADLVLLPALLLFFFKKK